MRGYKLFAIYTLPFQIFAPKQRDPLEKHTKSPGGHTYMIITQTITYD